MAVAEPRLILAECLYQLDNIVILKVSSEEIKGMITAIIIRKSGYLYEVSWEDRSNSWHFEEELIPNDE